MRLIDADELKRKYAGWYNVYEKNKSIRCVEVKEIDWMPTIDAVPLEPLAAMLSTIGANINCYYCREVLGECTKPPEEREYECDSMAHWADFLNSWRQKMEEQDGVDKPGSAIK